MPFDPKKYPANWKEIRARILEREGHKCKFCGVPNKAIGYRRKTDGVFVETPEYGPKYAGGWFVDSRGKIIQIILTIAHLENPDPMDCREENLAALCQKCHLTLDGPLHAANARKTRAAKSGQGALI